MHIPQRVLWFCAYYAPGTATTSIESYVFSLARLLLSVGSKTTFRLLNYDANHSDWQVTSDVEFQMIISSIITGKVAELNFARLLNGYKLRVKPKVFSGKTQIVFNTFPVKRRFLHFLFVLIILVFPCFLGSHFSRTSLCKTPCGI